MHMALLHSTFRCWFWQTENFIILLLIKINLLVIFIYLKIARTISARKDPGSLSFRFFPTSHKVFSTQAVPLYPFLQSMINTNYHKSSIAVDTVRRSLRLTQINIFQSFCRVRAGSYDDGPNKIYLATSCWRFGCFVCPWPDKWYAICLSLV